jgi:hypothetical protein
MTESGITIGSSPEIDTVLPEDRRKLIQRQLNMRFILIQVIVYPRHPYLYWLG